MVPLGAVRFTLNRTVGDERVFERFVGRPIIAGELTEKPPAGTIPREVVETDIGRDRLEPASRRGAFANDVESFERTKKDGLCDIFRLNRVTQKPDSGPKHHVLIPADKCLKPVGGGHASAVARPVSLGKNPDGLAKFQLRSPHSGRSGTDIIQLTHDRAVFTTT